MGIIQWWNDRKKKEEPVETQPKSKAAWELPEEKLSDSDRIAKYIADGGELADLSNKDRLPNDGFESDGALMKPWNQAHAGTKAGLASMIGRKR